MDNNRIYIDFETRSEIDLRKVGAWKYAFHASTSILCIAITYESGESHCFVPKTFEGFDEFERVVQQNPGAVWVAHNAFFEQCLWRGVLEVEYGISCPPPEKWVCTAAKAAAHALPRNLEQASEVLKLPFQKDMEGHRVMMKLCKPRRASKTNPDKFWEPDTAPEDFEKLYEYCIHDTKVSRAIDQHLSDLNEFEQHLWVLDQKINLRGLTVDLAAIRNALSTIDRYTEEQTKRFAKITSYALKSPTQTAKFLEWVQRELPELQNLQSNTIKPLLGNVDIQSNVREALQIRAELSQAANKKYVSMLDRADSLGRVRENFLYHGASTGRWSGTGVQFQNLMRPIVDPVKTAQKLVDYEYEEFVFTFEPNVMAALGSAVRGVVIPANGKRFYCGDFSSVESMGTAWLTNDKRKLELFRNKQDVYCHIAEGIYGYPINKKDHPQERQVGKTGELAFGYQGGIAAIATMAKGYNVNIEPVYDVLWPTTDEYEQEAAHNAYKIYMSRKPSEPLSKKAALAADIIKQRWRKAHPALVEFWSDTETAAISAVQNPGKTFICGKVFWVVEGDFLFCTLPSNRRLAYYRPKLAEALTPWGETKHVLSHCTVESMTKRFIRINTYGGKLVENITQGLCRDLLAEAMVRVEDYGFEIVLTAHDEILAERAPRDGLFDTFLSLMAQPPTWASDFPLAVEGWEGLRYRK